MAVGIKFVLIAGLLAFVPLPTEAANILGVFTSHSPSHLIIHMAHARALVERGHNVTVVTTIPVKNFGFNHIFVPPSKEAQADIDEVKSALFKFGGSLKFMTNMPSIFSNFGRASRDAIKDPRIQDIIHNPDNKFDLMILGYFMNEFELGIASKLNCPIVISWLMFSCYPVDRYIGNPTEVTYVRSSPFFSQGDPKTFLGRLRNHLNFAAIYLFFFSVQRQNENSYKELFPPSEYPSLAEVSKRVSLVFANSHLSEGFVRPNVPALIDVGGIQIKDKPDPLPEKLLAIVESSSEHGIIYVSFGSNLETKYLDSGFNEKLYEVLSNVKQTVLWKWDAEDKPGNAPNIHFKKWLPQDDLLAHPNMKLFITHAGKGSVAESQFHGVPMIAIPMFADQPSNAQKLADDGFGIKLDHLTMTGEELKLVVSEVLENPKYKDAVKRFSTLYRDRPMTAKETAVYWMEYVIRHKGAQHMQSPLVHLNWFQYLSLDVIAFLLVVAYVSFKLLKCSVKFGCKLICGRLCSKKQKVKNQ